MDRERWQRLEAVFDRCLELPLSERAGFLDEACGGDAGLRAEAEALLAADEAEASTFLDLPAAERAAPFLEESFEDPEPEEPPPESIGPYRVLEPLGQGGMGEVYRGYDARLRRPVALKRVRFSAGGWGPVRRRFQREARAMARLSHSAVVQVYDWVEAEGEEWIVMELVDGRPLRELLEQGPVVPAEAVRIGRTIAAGLAAAHAAGVVHRDLKLDNVMATSSGEVKILDFGIARPLRDEEGDGPSLSNLTVAGMVVGTVIAMSPEQALGQRVDHRSDLFSLGSLLYELLTGESPFRGGSAMETLSRICSLKQVPVIRLRPEVPPALSALVDHLLEKEPAGRPANAREVVAALDGIAAGLPSGARRWKWGAAAAVAIAVCLLALQPGARRGLGALRPDPPAAAPSLPATAYDHYRQGMAALELHHRPGQIDRAVDSFRRAGALDAGYAPAHAGLARAYWRKFREEKDRAWLEKARGNALRALELDGQLTAARVSLALIGLAEGEREAAKRQIDEVLALDPANADAHRALADYHVAAGDPAAAEAAYRKAVELRPGDLDLHSNLGSLYYRLGRYADAEAAFLRAGGLDPADYSSHKNLAAVYHMQGRYAEAARSLQKALEIKADPRVYGNLGTLYFFQGLYPQAVAAFEKAVELGANDYQAWGNLGDAYRWTPGNEDQGKEAYRTAVHLLKEEIGKGTESPVLRARLANYLAKRGNGEEALRELRRLEGTAGTDGAACFNATQAAEIAGARDLALAFLRQTLAAGYSLEEIRKDPELSGLRKDPRFHRLMTQAEAREP
jgi:tetratricopeptide (TPR) repeat protein/predicted Ser/Thr protein kinase